MEDYNIFISRNGVKINNIDLTIAGPDDLMELGTLVGVVV